MGITRQDEINIFADEPAACRALIEAISPAFEIFSEVDVRHAAHPDHVLRADLVVIPRDPTMADVALAFEVKQLNAVETQRWAKTLTQAHHYVLATIAGSKSDPDRIAPYRDRRIAAAFVFPALPWVHAAGTDEDIFHSGMAHLAGYLRVGRARFHLDRRQQKQLALCFGSNDVWDSRRGWVPHSRPRLVGKRQVGSQRVLLSGLIATERLAEPDSSPSR